MNRPLFALLLLPTLFSSACKDRGADPTPASTTAAPTVSSAKNTEPTPTTSATASAVPSASASADADDCLSRCKVFTRKRAECVEPFTKDLKMAPAMKAKVIAGHKDNADGHECLHMCTDLGPAMVGNQKKWGTCAAEATCDAFVTCYKKSNE